MKSSKHVYSQSVQFPLTSNMRIQYNFVISYHLFHFWNHCFPQKAECPLMIGLIGILQHSNSSIQRNPKDLNHLPWGCWTTDLPRAPRKRASIRSDSTLKSALCTGFRIHSIGSENSIRLVSFWWNECIVMVYARFEAGVIVRLPRLFQRCTGLHFQSFKCFIYRAIFWYHLDHLVNEIVYEWHIPFIWNIRWQNTKRLKTQLTQHQLLSHFGWGALLQWWKPKEFDLSQVIMLRRMESGKCNDTSVHLSAIQLQLELCSPKRTCWRHKTKTWTIGEVFPQNLWTCRSVLSNTLENFAANPP